MTDSLEVKVARELHKAVYEAGGEFSDWEFCKQQAYIDRAKRIIPIIKEEGITEGLDAALTAYESTCQGLIEEARDSIMQAIKGIENPYDKINQPFVGLYKAGFNEAIQAVLNLEILKEE